MPKTSQHAKDANAQTSKRLHGLVFQNSNGGIYQPGRRYNLSRKEEVRHAFYSLYNDIRRDTYSTRKVAAKAKVSPKFAQKVLDEMRNSRDKPLEDPDLKWEERIIKWKKHIDPREVLDDSGFSFFYHFMLKIQANKMQTMLRLCWM